MRYEYKFDEEVSHVRQTTVILDREITDEEVEVFVSTGDFPEHIDLSSGILLETESVNLNSMTGTPKRAVFLSYIHKEDV